jgi:CDP-glycerol glycerophosphotransferase (TagB/SpsB family)
MVLGVFVCSRAASGERRAKRVAFQAYSTHLAQFYRTIIDELRGAGDVELEFVILPHPHLPLSSSRDLRGFARQQLGFGDDQIRPFARTLWRRYDALICADVYARFPLRRSGRTILLRHGPGVNRRHLERRLFRKTVFDFDVCLVPGEHDREILSAASKRHRATRIVAAGQPHLDRLGAVEVTRSRYLADLGLDAELPTVLFAPRWSALGAQPDGGVGYWDEVVETLLAFDANIVVKMHHCSYYPSMAGGIDWGAKLDAVVAPRLAVDHDVDDGPALEHADVLITDTSSRAFNFMLLEKPVVLWDPPARGARRESQREDLLRRGSLVAGSLAEASALVGAALAGSRSAAEAPAVAAECFSNVGGATAAVVDCIRSELELPGLDRDPLPERGTTVPRVATRRV